MKRRCGVIFTVFGALLIILFFSIIVIFPVNAQTTMVQQERCPERAKRFFFENGYKFDETFGYFKSVSNYTSHYNKKLDKCFIRIDSMNTQRNKKGEFVQYHYLYDVFDEKEYGAFCFDNTGNVLKGYVGNKKCGSLEEFESLIRPYLEE